MELTLIIFAQHNQSNRLVKPTESIYKRTWHQVILLPSKFFVVLPIKVHRHDPTHYKITNSKFIKKKIMAPPKTYTLAQVKEHCNAGNDVWIVLHDKVYNVTKFLSEVCSYGNWPIFFSHSMIFNDLLLKKKMTLITNFTWFQWNCSILVVKRCFEKSVEKMAAKSSMMLDIVMLLCKLQKLHFSFFSMKFAWKYNKFVFNHFQRTNERFLRRWACRLG